MATISRRGGSSSNEQVVVLKKHIQELSYNAEGNVEYLGIALPNVATSSSGWQIRKMVYSGSDVVAILFAGGTSDFDKVWDLRTTYSYS
jgi:hypothetical protein